MSVYTQRWLLILGAIYVLTIIYAPQGIVGAVRQWLPGNRAVALRATRLEVGLKPNLQCLR